MCRACSRVVVFNSTWSAIFQGPMNLTQHKSTWARNGCQKHKWIILTYLVLFTCLGALVWNSRVSQGTCVVCCGCFFISEKTSSGYLPCMQVCIVDKCLAAAVFEWIVWRCRVYYIHSRSCNSIQLQISQSVYHFWRIACPCMVIITLLTRNTQGFMLRPDIFVLNNAPNLIAMYMSKVRIQPARYVVRIKSYNWCSIKIKSPQYFFSVYMWSD